MSSYITHHRVIGAAASALPSHGRGHRFDSYITHHRAARRAAFFVGFVGFPPFRAACRKRVAAVGFGRWLSWSWAFRSAVGSAVVSTGSFSSVWASFQACRM